MPRFLRRRRAAEHLRDKYEYRGGPGGLAKLATKGGGPEMRYCNGIPYYPEDKLDAWYEGRFDPPVTSTSARPPGVRRRGRMARPEHQAQEAQVRRVADLAMVRGQGKNTPPAAPQP